MDYTIQYLEHETGRRPRMRVRRSDWPNDAFEVVSHEQWETFKNIAERLNLPLEEINL